MISIDRLTSSFGQWINYTRATTTMAAIGDMALVILILLVFNTILIMNHIYRVQYLIDILHFLETQFYSKLFSIVNINVQVKGDKNILKRPRRALVVSNHSSLFDYLVIALLARAGEATPLFMAWNHLIHLPQLKWLMKRFFLTESWVYSSRPMTSIDTKKSYWITIFPEVLRFTPELQKEQEQLCLAAGAPVFKNVLYPRLQTFTSVTTSLTDQGIIDTIFDLTLSYERKDFKLSSTFKKNPINVTVHIRSASLGRLKRRGTKGLQRWLESSWVEKDAILHQNRDEKLPKARA